MIYLVLRLAGGFSEGPKVGLYEGVERRSSLGFGPSILEVAPGGLIRQDLRLDSGKYEWATMPITTLRIRVVDPASFKELTGLQPPPRPPTAGWQMEPVGWNLMMDEVAVASVAEHERYRPSAVAFTRAELEAGGPGRPLEQHHTNAAENTAPRRAGVLQEAPKHDQQEAGDGEKRGLGVKKFFRRLFN